MKDLPVGIGLLSTIIENNYLYVDKTEFAYKMAKPGKKYFLSRPRRFGKSLMVSTLEELYSSNKELFKGLYIYDKWDWSKKFPIVHMDFAGMSYDNLNILKKSINNFLQRTAEKHDIDLVSGDLLTDKFKELLEKLSEKHAEKVVVLIDEYDKAILDNIENIELAQSIRSELNSFYGTLKSTEKVVEFIFITGVSKFSKTSIFSGLNNISDLTLNPNYANICGYTQEELELYFKDRIEDLAEYYSLSNEEILKNIKTCYNGYSYNGKDFLYNPYSILSLFSEKTFDNFWFESGTPSFLTKYMKNKPQYIGNLFNPNTTIKGKFPNFDLEHLDLNTLLLQTGYLTIKDKIIEVGKSPRYKLGIPNREVNDSLYTSILASYINRSVNDIEGLVENILESIVKLDEKAIEKTLNRIFATIPHQVYDGIKEEVTEATYHMVLLAILKTIGFDVYGEVSSHKGDLDVVLDNNEIVLIIEMKHSAKSSFDYIINKAMNQIHEKKYYQPYLDKNIILLAIAVKDREVKCKFQHLNENP